MHKIIIHRISRLAMMASVGILFGSGCGIDSIFRVGVRSIGGVEGLAALFVAALTGGGADAGA